MIIHALADYYNVLASDSENKINKAGWQVKKVGFAILINQQGELLSITPLSNNDNKSKKNEAARKMLVPHIDRQGTAMNPYFLCDNVQYTLGIDGNAEKLKSTSELCKQILSEVDNIYSRAIINFYDSWNIGKVKSHPVIIEYLENKDFLKSNIVFRLDETGMNLLDDALIQKAWDDSLCSTGNKGICLVSGERSDIARLHLKINGLYKGQSAGSSIISYNEKSFEYFGKKNGDVSPISESMMHSYTASLNWLLKKENNHVTIVGNISILYWSETSKSPLDFLMNAEFNPTNENADLKGFFDSIIQGRIVDTNLEKELKNKFYVLILSPNNARIAVKFFMANTFGYFLKNIQDHYENLKIEGAKKHLTIRDLISETVNKKVLIKNPKKI